MTVVLTVNGRRREVRAEPDTPLLYVLRDELRLNGVRYGCGVGQCGACTVLRDGAALRSCIAPIGELAGAEILTLEGLRGPDGALHPLQRAFIREQAGQCAYCAAEMILAAAALLQAVPHPSREEIRRTLDANLCRCGAHNRILRAIEHVAAEGA